MAQEEKLTAGNLIENRVIPTNPPLDGELSEEDRQAELRELQAYLRWINKWDTLTPERKQKLECTVEALEWKPRISVLMPVYNVPEKWLRRAIESILDQTYPYWEFCIADDASTDSHIRPLLEEYMRRDSRIKCVFRETNGHISEASNSALELVTGDYIALLDNDDELPAKALACVAIAVSQNPGVAVLYSDEDKIDAYGTRYKPYFKSDWNPDLFVGQNIISHLGVYRTDIVRAIGGFRSCTDGSQDWDLAIRAIDYAGPNCVVHIPEILYHWRAIPGSTAHTLESKSYIKSAAFRGLKDHFNRTGSGINLTPVAGGHWRTRYPLRALPLISIIIPNRNSPELLFSCIASIRAKSTYPRIEIVIVDNDSDDPDALQLLESYRATGIHVLNRSGPFNFSHLVNSGVHAATGELVCLLNNDLTVITPGWLEEMASHALRPGVGPVGAMLYYPNDTVQHAGVVLGVGGVASHAHKHFRRGGPGYCNRMRLVQSYSAVTGACLMIRKALFDEVGGFDEINLPVAFNDVDFCLRLRNKGFRTIWTPFAELYHYESASRGDDLRSDQFERFKREVKIMKKRWGDLLNEDPFYNRNLTLTADDFSVAESPRGMGLSD